MIVGISGYAQAGKDTVANILYRLYGVRRLAFATALKKIALMIDPIVDPAGSELVNMAPTQRLKAHVLPHGDPSVDLWGRAKALPEGRQFLQRLGDACRLHLGEDVWVNALSSRLGEGNFSVSDARYQNEARFIVGMSGIMVRVNRPGHGPANGHISEIGLDGYAFDVTIENDGTLEELEARVVELVGPFVRSSPAPLRQV